jgi:hypothetical protein
VGSPSAAMNCVGMRLMTVSAGEECVINSNAAAICDNQNTLCMAVYFLKTVNGFYHNLVHVCALWLIPEVLIKFPF